MLFTRKPFLNLQLFLCVVLSITLMVLELHQSRVRELRASFSVSVIPVQYLVSWPIQVMNWFSESLTNQRALLSENANLRALLLLQNAKVQKLLDIEQENTSLRALLKSSPRASERVSVAELLAIDLEPFVHQVVLNKGKTDGVYLGQPVLDATGIFGQVTEVGSVTSRVLLITDTRSAIPVADSRNGLRGIVNGTGNPQVLTLMNMPQTADIRPGDLLVASGLGGRFPAGYPVGKVASVSYSSDAEFAKVLVIPSAQLNQSRLVLLAWVHEEPDLVVDTSSEPEEKSAPAPAPKATKKNQKTPTKSSGKAATKTPTKSSKKHRG